MASNEREGRPWSGLMNRAMDAVGNLGSGYQEMRKANQENRERLNRKIQKRRGTVVEKRSSALPNLPRSVNTNLAAYDSSIPTNVGGGNAAQSKPKPTPAPSPSPTPTPAPTPTPTGRNAPSPSGGNAKGTNTGMKPMNLETAGILAGRGIADVTKFQSTALPDTAAGDYQHMKGYSDIDAFSLEHTAGKTGKYLEGFTGDRSDPTAMHAYAVNQGYKPNSTREIPSDTQKGSSNTADTADQSRSIPVAPPNHRNMVRGMGLEDDERFTNFGNDYGEYQNDPSQEQIDLENRNIRARTAFLDQNLDSVQAARASNAELGRYRDNGKYYANVGGKGQEITREGFNSLATNPDAAASLKDHYVKQIQENANPANSTNPQVEGNPGGEIATVDVPGIGAVEATVTGHNHFNVDYFTDQINNSADQVQDTAGGMAQSMLDKTKNSIKAGFNKAFTK